MILIKKMIRDIWNMKSQFVSIFLMCLLGILIYTGIEGVWYGMQLEKEDFFEESELAGVWVNGLNLTYKDRDDVDDLKGVDRSQLSAVYNREIRGVIYKGSVLNVFVGWIVGTVVGWYFLRLYVHTISTNTTIYSPYIKVSSYLLATGIALGCSVLVNIMVAKKAVAIDMVESLKSVE